MLGNNGNIKEELINAGRYDQVIDILTKISTDDETSDFPLSNPIVADGNITYWISAFYVKKEARKVIECIKDNNFQNKSKEHFDNVYTFINDTLECKLHNYAVSASHRKPDGEEVLEDIRGWLVLENMLICLNPFGEDETPWKVPEGWKRK